MTPDSIQRQARALGDPTRHGIFRYVADSDGPVDVSELTAHFGINHNAVRQHLARLVDAGLVVQGTAPAAGRGRPRQLFRIDPTADERWGLGGPYQRLSLMLVEMLRTGESAVDVGRRAGRQIDLSDLPETGAEESLLAALVGGGFDPVVAADGDTTEFVLRHCPFADTAAADPATVCALHLGMAQGLADRFQGVTVADLEPRDPRRAGCRLWFRVDNDRVELVE